VNERTGERLGTTARAKATWDRTEAVVMSFKGEPPRHAGGR